MACKVGAWASQLPGAPPLQSYCDSHSELAARIATHLPSALPTGSAAAIDWLDARTSEATGGACADFLQLLKVAGSELAGDRSLVALPPQLPPSQYLHQTLALHSAMHLHKAALLHAHHESPRNIAFIKGVLDVRRMVKASFKRFLDAGQAVLRADRDATLAPLDVALTAVSFVRTMRLDMFDQRHIRPPADVDAGVDRLRLFALAESLALAAWRKQLDPEHRELSGQSAAAIATTSLALDNVQPEWIPVDDLPLPTLAADHVPGAWNRRAVTSAAVFAASLEVVSLCQEMRIWAVEGGPQTVFGPTARDSAGIWGLFAAHAAALPPASIVGALTAASRLHLVDMPPALNNQLAAHMLFEHSACSVKELAVAVKYLSAWESSEYAGEGSATEVGLFFSWPTYLSN